MQERPKPIYWGQNESFHFSRLEQKSPRGGSIFPLGWSRWWQSHGLCGNIPPAAGLAHTHTVPDVPELSSLSSGLPESLPRGCVRAWLSALYFHLPRPLSPPWVHPPFPEGTISPALYNLVLIDMQVSEQLLLLPLHWLRNLAKFL